MTSAVTSAACRLEALPPPSPPPPPSPAQYSAAAPARARAGRARAGRARAGRARDGRARPARWADYTSRCRPACARAGRRRGRLCWPGATIPPPLRLIVESRSRTEFRHKPSKLTNEPAPIRRERTHDSEPTHDKSALADSPERLGYRDSDRVEGRCCCCVCVCVEAGRAGPVVVHCSGSNPALLDAAAAWCAAADTESGGGPACGGESVSAEASEMLWNGINGC